MSRGSNLHPAGKQVTTATIAGHRDMSKTSCPGDACFRLIPSRLVPAAVVAAGVRPATATKPPARAPVTAPAGSPAATPAEPAAAPVAPPATAPEDTLPAVNPGGLPPDTTPPPTVAPPTFPGAATASSPRSGVPIVTGVAAAGVTAAAAFLALVLRRRASTRECEHWEHARRLEEVDGPAGPPGGRGEPGA